jgi:hypothetical protein
MAGYVSTEQYVWGLHRLLDGITAGAASEPERSFSSTAEDTTGH